MKIFLMPVEHGAGRIAPPVGGVLYVQALFRYAPCSMLHPCAMRYVLCAMRYTLLPILSCFTIYAQPSFDLEIEQFVIRDTLYIDFMVTYKGASSDTFAFGTSNFVINLDSVSLDVANKVKVGVFDGPWDDGISSAWYDDLGLGGASYINLTIVQNDTVIGGGVYVSSAKTRIGRIAVPILNCSDSSNITWNTIFGAINDWDNNDIQPFANFINPSNISLNALNYTTFSLTADKDTICLGDSVLFVVLPLDSIYNYNFLSKNGDSLQSLQTGTENTFTATGLVNGDSIIVIVQIATDSATCNSPPIDTIPVTVISISADAGLNTTICLFNPDTLGGTPTASGGSGSYSYSWLPVLYLDDATISNPVFTPLGSPVPYDYTVEITDVITSCTASDSKTIIVEPKPPAAIITNNISPAFCTGDSIRLSANLIPGATYQWFRNDTAVTNAVINDTVYYVTSGGSYTVNISAVPISDIVSVPVAYFYDDAREDSSGNVSITGTLLPMGYISGSPLISGMQFRIGVYIPQGSVIDSAWIEFITGFGDLGSPVDLFIVGDDVDDAVSYVETTNNITARVLTTASVAWSPPSLNPVGSKLLTTSLVTIVQEIVNRPDWRPGNSMAFRIEPVSGTGIRLLYSFDGSDSITNIPRLKINWSGFQSCDSTSDPITVIMNMPPVINLSNDTAICQSDTLTLNADNPGAAYIWSTLDTTQLISVSSADTFWVDVTDTNGCTNSDSIIVTINPLPFANFTVDTTQGIDILTINITNLATDYDTLFWDYGDGTPRDTTTTPTHTHTYTNTADSTVIYPLCLYALTQWGCSDTLCDLITLYPQINADFAMLPDTQGCNPYTVDFVNLSTGADTFYWDYGDGSTVDTTYDTTTIATHTFNNTSVAFDSIYCVKLIAISQFGSIDTAIHCVIIHPTPVSSTIDTTLCQGDSLMAGGAWQTTTGTYYDTSIATNGCDSITTTNLTVLALVSSTIDTTICQGDSLQVGGTYQTITGTYYDTTTAASGCDSITTTNLTVLASVSSTIDTTICQGDSLLAGGAWQTTSGTYYDTSTVANGCDSIITTIITVIPPVAANAGIDDTICSGLCDTLDASTSVCFGSCSFAWNSDPSLSDTSLSSPVACPFTTTSYVVMVTDNITGCSSSDVVTVVVNPSPVIDLGTDLTGCTGDTFALTAPSGYVYLWSTGAITQTIIVNISNNYRIKITDTVTGCFAFDSISIQLLLTNPVASIAPLGIYCNDQPIDFTGLTTVTPAGVKIKWSYTGAGSLNNDTILNPIYTPASSDTGSVVFTLTISNDCDTINVSSIAIFKAAPIANIIATPQSGTSLLQVLVNEIITFDNVDPLQVEDTIISWNFGDGTILNTTTLPVIHSYNSVASYQVVLLINNSSGCFDYDTISITIISNQILYIPNVFSPLANDPENQVVKVYGEIHPEGLEFRIYNRWGELIFQSVSQQEGWNGKYQNSGVNMGTGVYTYVVKGKFLDGTEFKEVGTVTLIR